MSDILICPKCQERLWVGEMQIPLITCPKCLARIINPNAGRETVGTKPNALQRRPRQVIPLEEEAGRDIRDTTRWLVALALALFLGAIVIASKIGVNTLSVVLTSACVTASDCRSRCSTRSRHARKSFSAFTSGLAPRAAARIPAISESRQATI